MTTTVAPRAPLARGRQRRRLGVRPAELGVPALTHQLPVLQHDRADQRVGLHPSPASPGELEGAGHRLPLVHRR